MTFPEKAPDAELPLPPPPHATNSAVNPPATEEEQWPEEIEEINTAEEDKAVEEVDGTTVEWDFTQSEEEDDDQMTLF